MVVLVVKIPKATLKRMFHEFHPDMKISGKALARMEITVGDFIRMTFSDSKKIAENSKRKTVLEKDLILATE